MKKNRIIALLLSLAALAYSGAAVFADEDASTQDTGAEQTENTDMTQDGSADAAGGSQTGGDAIYMENDSLTPPEIMGSQAAMLIDADTGRLLYGKNIDAKLYPASLTKMMTAVLALENGNLEDVVTVPYEAIASVNILEDSNMGLLTGEELTFEQLVSAMLIHSANDAANVIAFHISGSIEAFVELMNKKAADIGMTNTHFVNACGTHDDNHYTTARDMATLARYAMQNEKFREIVKTPIYKIPQTNKYSLGERTLVNTNYLLSTILSLYQYYAPATGIKTGHTSQAGYCLVSSASFSDMNLIAVTMKCDSMDEHKDPYTYSDSRRMFEFAFANYAYQQLAAPGDIISSSKVYEAKNGARVALTVKDNLTALISADTDSASEIIPTTDIPETIQAPVAKGDVVGTVTYTYKGTQIASAELIATNDVELNYFLHIFHIILKVITSPFFFIPVLLIIILALYMRHLKKKKERKRRIQQLKKARESQNKDKNEDGNTPRRKTERIEQQRKNTKDSNSRFRH